jgi:lincosamide and streptogramin A transport system ATP-binding/permease protein
MSHITIHNFTFTHEMASEPLFNQVSFQIDSDWKLGFIGRNGRGKTSFLECLMNKHTYSGSINHSIEFEYFPYVLKDENLITRKILMDHLPTVEFWKIERELNLLDINETVYDRAFHTLSDGEKNKILLAILFLKENAFLLIDEPTNHLDQNARLSIATYLKSKSGFILVSHDRRLLNECVDHILVINKTNIEVQKGNFDSWWMNKQREDQFELNKNEKLKKETKRLKEAALRTSLWSDEVEKSKLLRNNPINKKGGRLDRGYIGHKSAKMMKRAKSIENRQLIAIEEKSKLLKNLEENDALKLHPLVYRQSQICSIINGTIQYDNLIVCEDISISLHQGDRMAISGKNGSGKSSILKIIKREKELSKGDFLMNRDVSFSVIEQDTSFLQGNLNAFISMNNCDETLFKAILRKLDFDREQFSINLENYSEGQKKKVLIAKSLSQSAHVYIWDEPLNFIDVLSKIQIENLIMEYKPTLIFVEHDEMFVEKIATKVINLDTLNKF